MDFFWKTFFISKKCCKENTKDLLKNIRNIEKKDEKMILTRKFGIFSSSTSDDTLQHILNLDFIAIIANTI